MLAGIINLKADCAKNRFEMAIFNDFSIFILKIFILKLKILNINKKF